MSNRGKYTYTEKNLIMISYPLWFLKDNSQKLDNNSLKIKCSKVGKLLHIISPKLFIPLIPSAYLENFGTIQKKLNVNEKTVHYGNCSYNSEIVNGKLWSLITEITRP